MAVQEHAVSQQPHESVGFDLRHAHNEVKLDKPKHTWLMQGYGLSAARRSSRIKFKKKFHDEIWIWSLCRAE